MPDNTDGASEIAELGLPKPDFEDSSQSNPSESVTAIAARYEQRLKETEERLRREFQSKYDKDTANVRKTYGDLSELQKALAEVKAGGDPDKIFAATEQRNLYAKVEELEKRLSAPNPVSSGKSEQDEAYAQAVGLLKEAGLDNDPGVMKLMGGKYKNANDFLFEVNRFTLQNITKKPAAAASASSPAGGARTASNASDIQSQIDAITGDRIKALSAEGRAELRQLAKQLEELEAR